MTDRDALTVDIARALHGADGSDDPLQPERCERCREVLREAERVMAVVWPVIEQARQERDRATRVGAWTCTQTSEWLTPADLATRGPFTVLHRGGGTDG